MLNEEKYSDFLMIDRHHRIVFADMGNPRFLRDGPEDLKGLELNEVLVDIDENYPLLKAIDQGVATEHFETRITNANGFRFHLIGSAYPVTCAGTPVLAIQFSNLYYQKKDINQIHDQAESVFTRINGTKYILSDIITQDPAMNQIKKQIPEIASLGINVLICGETGTGKELVAQAIHNSSRAFLGPFISQNCGAIPENLLEGILFGTTKGSFTGAEDREGLFEMAEGGTIFLDEINSLSLNMQTKILRAVENKVVSRVGEMKERKIHVRVIAATNESLEDLIREGRFKSDLYYRLAGIRIDLPPLAERKGDVPLLVSHFINYFNRWTRSHVEMPDQKVLDMLDAYSWPGNVRELRNLIEGAFALNEDNVIGMDEIPDYIIEAVQGDAAVQSGGSLKRRLDTLERSIVEEQLRRDDGSLKAAAAHLGISKQLLHYKLNKGKSSR
ncbi:MAG: sigma-54 interaction domain-containing protein [Anaerovoracaceae bacterium]